jgi:hypothetical protein
MSAGSTRAAVTPRRFFSELLQRQVDPPPAEARCVGCGCTDSQACAGGCYWLEVNRRDGTGVCSSCPDQVAHWRRLQ